MKGAEFIPEQLQETVSRYWERLEEHAGFPGELQALLDQDQVFRGELMRVWCASDFAAGLTLSQPGLLLDVAARRLESGTAVENRLREQLTPLRELDYQGGVEQLKSHLRCFHRLEYLLIIWRDLVDWPLQLTSACRCRSLQMPRCR